MDGEKHDEYVLYQQHYRKPANAGGAVNRYEVGRRSLQSRQLSAKGKIIKVYTNGPQTKPAKPPIIITFMKRMTMDFLLNQIGVKSKTRATCLYKWPSGERVFDVCDIDDDTDTEKLYVCSEKPGLNKKGCYGGIPYGAASGGARSALTEKYSRNGHDSRGTIGSQKHSPTALRSNGSMNGGSKASCPLNVVSNKTGERISLFKDPSSKQTFDDILKTIQEMLGGAHHPPVHTLYSMNKPDRKINSMSSLNRALQLNEDTFLACTRNEEPDQKLLRSRDMSPLRNGYQQRQKNSNKQNGYHDDRMQQSNGYAMQQESHVDSHGRRYQRHHDDEEEEYLEDEIEQEEYDQEPSSPPPRRVVRQQDQSPRRDRRQSPNRYSQRRNEENDSPQRDNRKATNRRLQRQEDEDEEEDTRSRGNRRESERQKPKRRQTPQRREENRRRDDRDDDDDDDNDREDNHPSEEEMQRRIKAMEQVDPDLDKDIPY